MNRKTIIFYDFDGTLTPYAWTKFKILEECGLENGGSNPEFVRRVNEIAEIKGTNTYASLWEVYFDYLRANNFALTDDNFSLGAENLEYNPGVKDFLANSLHAPVENYILSSGMKVFLKHTEIAHYFKDIFATTFSYDQNGHALGVDYLMHEKNKVEIIRNVLKTTRSDANDASNVIYIGDGLTDYYAMDYIKSHGGQSIFVYRNPKDDTFKNINSGHQNLDDTQLNTKNNAFETNKILKELRSKNAVSFAAKADYTPGSELWTFLNQNIL